MMVIKKQTSFAVGRDFLLELQDTFIWHSLQVAFCPNSSSTVNHDHTGLDFEPLVLVDCSSFAIDFNKLETLPSIP